MPIQDGQHSMSYVGIFLDYELFVELFIDFLSAIMYAIAQFHEENLTTR